MAPYLRSILVVDLLYPNKKINTDKRTTVAKMISLLVETIAKDKITPSLLSQRRRHWVPRTVIVIV